MKSTLETELTTLGACETDAGRQVRNSYANWTPAVVALAVLALCEIAVYWFCVRQSGFYLDDWTMVSQLHFAQQDLLSLVHRCMNDNRVLPRPLEAIHFPLVWLAFKANPLGYHILNCVLEVLAGWLLYLTINRIAVNRTMALSAAMIFLVYPIHDATHYWMVATSVTLSLVLYLGSLWSAVRYAETIRDDAKESSKFLWTSAVAFAASIINYEAFAPLCVVNAVAVFLILRGRQSAYVEALKSLMVAIPTCICLVLYQRVLAFTLGSNFVPPHHLGVGHFFDVMLQGLSASISLDVINFSIERARDAIAVGITRNQIIYFVSFLLVSFGAFVYYEVQRRRGEQNLFPQDRAKSDCLNIFILGVVCLLASYTIFGVAQGYYPQLASIYNRVNTGAAVGASLMFAAILTWLSRSVMSKIKLTDVGSVSVVSALIMSTALAPLLVLSTLADWGLASQWRRSWDVQRRIADILVAHRGELQPGDSVILANAPRYVMWSPVFDGVWDFQAMMRLCLDNPKIKGGVVSERMIVTEENVEDVSKGFSCAKYDYERMFVLIPHPEQLIRVQSAQEFVDVVQNKGMFFGLSQTAVDGWKKSLNMR